MAKQIRRDAGYIAIIRLMQRGKKDISYSEVKECVVKNAGFGILPDTAKSDLPETEITLMGEHTSSVCVLLYTQGDSLPKQIEGKYDIAYDIGWSLENILIEVDLMQNGQYEYLTEKRQTPGKKTDYHLGVAKAVGVNALKFAGLFVGDMINPHGRAGRMKHFLDSREEIPSRDICELSFRFRIDENGGLQGEVKGRALYTGEPVSWLIY